MKSTVLFHPLRFTVAAALLSVVMLFTPPVARAILPTIAPNETMVFSDDFDNNAAGWNNIDNTGADVTKATIGADPQLPGVSAWFPNNLTTSPAFPGVYSYTTLSSAPNVWQGAVSVYMRARVWTPPPTPSNVGENNKFTIVLAEDNGLGNAVATASTALGQLIIKPTLESSASRPTQVGFTWTNNTGALNNQLTYNVPAVYLFSATNYVDYRLTLWATNDDASMTLVAQRYNTGTQAWEQLGSAPQGLVGSGNFNILQMITRAAQNISSRSNNCRAFFDSVAVGYYSFTNLPPSSTWYVENLTPGDGALFASAAGGISFNVTARAPNAVPQSAIQVFLNSQEVTGSAVINGNNTNWLVTLGGLQDNKLYNASIVLTDGQGAKRVKNWSFGTFIQAAITSTEVEDYNFGLDGNCGGAPIYANLPTAGGDYYDPAAPDSFLFLTALPGADYFSPVTLTNSINAYRMCDQIGVRTSKDVARDWFGGGGVDYDLNNIPAGSWANYTRSATAGVYRVFLRAAALQSQPTYLNRVTGQTRLPGQTTRPLGQFQASAAPDGVCHLLSLKDVVGNDVLVALDPTNTLRLTFGGQHGTFFPNFFMFFPATGAVPPVIARTEPVAGNNQVERHAPISIVIGEGQSPLNLASLGVWLDGTNVTASTTNLYNSGTLTVGYVPPTWFAAGSTHTVTVMISDNSGPALTASNQWSFTALSRTTYGATRINFEPSNRAVPAGFLADTGLTFDDRGNGYSYGWNTTNTAFATERLSPLSPSAAHDTFILLNPQATNSRIWEISMPAGRYGVFGVAGDPGEFTSNFQLSIEGVPLLSGVPTPLNPWVSGYALVDVSDGRLTLTAQNLANNKINLLEITPAVNLQAMTPAFGSGGFSLSFATQPRRPYRVQYKLSPGGYWVTAGVVVGDGAVKSYTDSSATGDATRLYRVVAE